VTVLIPAGTYLLTECGVFTSGGEEPESGDLDASPQAPLHLIGLGSGATIVQTCPGERVLTVGPSQYDPEASAPVTLTNLTLTGGTPAGSGGGIYATGDLTLESTSVTGNRAGPATAADGAPGAASRGGGVFALGSVTVVGGRFVANTATGGTGGTVEGNGPRPTGGDATVAPSTRR
jgi:hypothetical protein